MRFYITALATLLISLPVNGFTAKGPSASRTAKTQLFLEPETLTDYMAKAHEEKLLAIKAAEAKKDAEIQALKNQMQDLKQGGGALTVAANTDVGDMTKEQMAAKLISYQNFMAKYIVDAQKEKAKAVASAEMALRQKFEAQLLLAGSAPAPVKVETTLYEGRNQKVSAAAKAGKSRWGDMENQRAVNGAAAVTSTPANGAKVNGLSVPAVADQSLFDSRNRKIAAAGKAGKSRWGDMEVAKATSQAAALPSASTTPAVPVSIPIPAEVEAADHGLRNDGGVGGPSLAERVNLGSQLFGAASASVAAVPAVAVATGASLFDKRNAMIAAAGKAGKSRWGDMEIQKASAHVSALPSAGSPPATASIPPEVEQADHGLRADGGVGGPSLAQRVNLGSSLLGLGP